MAGLAALLLAVGASSWLGFRRLRSTVARATDPARTEEGRARPLAFSPIGHARFPMDLFADPSLLSVAAAGGELWTAGGLGLSDGTRSFDPAVGLPSARVGALAAGRKDVVFGLEAGGWGRDSDAGLETATSGWGQLEVRVFAETEAGELLLGARQGLFLAPYGNGSIERISGEPVRAVALLPGGLVAAGGERGLQVLSLSGTGTRSVATPDPWIESLGWDGKSLWASTPLGTAVGDPLAERLLLDPHPRGGDVRKGLVQGGAWWGLADGGRLAALLRDGTRSEEPNPDGFRRLFSVGGSLFAEAPAGLFRRETGGWTLVRKTLPGALPLSHVNALASTAGELFLGFFDGGVASCRPGPIGSRMTVRPVSGSAAWGVNALLPSGGTVWAATLRGVFKIRGGRVEPVDGPGGAYSLAPTPTGIALGYGQGVSLPGGRLLSAFHGLPGNQAYALTAARGSDALWVGTPTGLGRIENARVTARALPGEGKLPHPLGHRPRGPGQPARGRHLGRRRGLPDRRRPIRTVGRVPRDRPPAGQRRRDRPGPGRPPLDRDAGRGNLAVGPFHHAVRAGPLPFALPERLFPGILPGRPPRLALRRNGSRTGTKSISRWSTTYSTSRLRVAWIAVFPIATVSDAR